MQHIGIVKWFDSEKGFGVVSNPDIGDVFFHKNNLKINQSDICQLKPLVFELRFDERKQRKKGVNVNNVWEDGHFFSLLHLLGTDDSIEVDFLNPNSYLHRRKESKKISLLETVFKEVFKDKEKAEIVNKIINFYETDNDQEKIIDYFSFVILNISKVFDQNKAKEINAQLISEISQHLSDDDLLLVFMNTNFDVSYLSYDKKNYFLRFSMSSHEKILSSLNFEEKIGILKSFYQEYDAIHTLRVLVDFVTSEYQIPRDALGSWQRDDEKFNDFPYDSKNLIQTVQDFVTADLSMDELKLLFREKLIPPFFFTHAPLEFIDEYSLDEIERILYYQFKNPIDNTNFLCVLVDEWKRKLEMLNPEALSKLYELAKKYSVDYDFFDNIVLMNIGDRYAYAKLWEAGLAQRDSEHNISLLLENEENIKLRIDKWIAAGIIDSQSINKILYKEISTINPLQNRIIFNKAVQLLKFYIDNDLLSPVYSLNNPYFQVILWFLDITETFSFEALCDTFIYFKPENQVLIVKKLFYLKQLGQFDLTLDKLDLLRRFDLDLYELNKEFNPDVPVDISTEVIIQALKTFDHTQKFLMSGELIKVVLEKMRSHEQNRIQLKSYFENCSGRTTATYDWNTNGKITEVVSQQNSWFKFEFPYNEKLVTAVKNLPGRRYNSESKTWIVPLQYREEVRNFAISNKFTILESDGKNYTNNSHLVYFKKEGRPIGIRFCEGRLSKKLDDINNKEFWWCRNQPCFQNCETIHEPEQWKNYTLFDFCLHLGFDMDSVSSTGDHVKNGKYYEFITQVNRFNQLLEKLYCEECEHILFPAGTSNYAAYTVVRFKCENPSCSCKDKLIYLNHCLNGKCGCIIDSRESEKCPHGLHICSNCGSCCSTDMMKRRLDNLRKTGGYIHEKLISLVEDKAGHLERAEYFCHKCSHEMGEINHNVFKCESCSVTYDTRPYNLPRPYKHLKKSNSTNIDLSDEDEDVQI